MLGLTVLDIITLLLVGGGLFFGLMRGFVCEVLSLFAWVAAIIALKFGFEPAANVLTGFTGGYGAAAILAFILVFGVVFFGFKLLAGRIGDRIRRSAVGPVDRVLGGGFGMLKGLIGATLLYLAASLVYDTMYGRAAARPDWLEESRTYPLLHASGAAIVDFVEARRGTEPSESSSREK